MIYKIMFIFAVGLVSFNLGLATGKDLLMYLGGLAMLPGAGLLIAFGYLYKKGALGLDDNMVQELQGNS